MLILFFLWCDVFFLQENIAVSQMPPHIQDCIHIFTQDWQVVTKKSYPEPKEKFKELELVDQVFEVGIRGHASIISYR